MAKRKRQTDFSCVECQGDGTILDADNERVPCLVCEGRGYFSEEDMTEEFHYRYDYNG